MSTGYYIIELDQDSYGSAVIPLPDELCHDMGLTPGDRFDVEVEDDTITLKRLAGGYEIES
jgi:antitoxin component of MazEF toxin-antitoxin module